MDRATHRAGRCAVVAILASAVLLATPLSVWARALTTTAPAALPNQLLFVPTGSDQINIYDLHNPNKHGSLAQISSGLVGTQYEMTVDGAGDLLVVNDNFNNNNEEYVSVYAPPYNGAPTMLSGVLFPLGVAVDSAGTVYVSNCGAYCSQTPAVYVFANGSTTPTSTITSPAFSSLGGLAVDASGNLFIPSSDRATGASDVFEVEAGTTKPIDLRVTGLLNYAGPGEGSVAFGSGNLYVENNSNADYVLGVHAGKRNASSIIDSFDFVDTPGMLNYGPDGLLYVPINCDSQACEGSVVGFKPHAKTPSVIVGPAGAGILGVATSPNPNVAPRQSTPYAWQPYALHYASATHAIQPPQRAVARFAQTTVRSGLHALAARQPVFTAHRYLPAGARGSGWLSPLAKSDKKLVYIGETATGSGVGAVNVYSVKGQDQAPVGVLTSGISAPQGLATDKRGNLYVANSGNSTVTVYPPGQTNPSTTYANGVGTPYDVKVGSDGTVYIANLFGPSSAPGTVTEYPPGSTTPSATLALAGQNAVALALDAANDLFVSWYSLSSGVVQVYEYPPGSTSGTNLDLNLPGGSYPVYAMAFDHRGNLVLWYDSLDESSNYLATFAPGATQPSLTLPGGQFLTVVQGLAFPHSSSELYLSSILKGTGDRVSYPGGIPHDAILLPAATGVALSPGV